MSSILDKLARIKSRYYYWSSDRTQLRNSCSNCSSIGEQCHGDGQCDGDGE